MTSDNEIPMYQGWTNYPTWCVHLWITNDEDLYRVWRSRALDYKNRKHGALLFGDELKDWFGGVTPDNAIGVVRDLIGWASAYVNWKEIAAALMDG